MLLFLRNVAQWREDDGFKPADDPDDQYYYVRANRYQGLVRDQEGRATIAMSPAEWQKEPESFLRDVDSRAFDTLLADVRSSVAAAPEE